MAQEILKVLGQKASTAGGEIIVYTVPSGSRAAISGLFIFNNSGGNATIDLSIVPNGDNGANVTIIENTLLKGLVLTPKQGNSDATNVSGKGITLSEKDDIRFESDVTDVIIHVYGVEVIPEQD